MLYLFAKAKTAHAKKSRMMCRPKRFFSLALTRSVFIFLTLLSPLVSGVEKYSSNDEEARLEETIVYGKATKNVGISSSSSEGLVTLAALSERGP